MAIIDGFVDEQKAFGLTSQTLKDATILQVEFKNFFRNFDSNFKLYEMDQTTVSMN